MTLGSTDKERIYSASSRPMTDKQGFNLSITWDEQDCGARLWDPVLCPHHRQSIHRQGHCWCLLPQVSEQSVSGGETSFRGLGWGASIDCIFMEKALVRTHLGLLQGQCQHRLLCLLSLYFILPIKTQISWNDLALFVCLFQKNRG